MLDRQLLFPLLLLSLQVQGATLFETEPNNSVGDANTVAAPALIKGNLDSGDQDAFIWEISDTDAQHTWSLSLQGALGHIQSLTLYDLADPQQPGELARFDKSTQQLQLAPSPLLLAPGTYMLGMAGKGDYLLTIHAHSKLATRVGFPQKLSFNAEQMLYLSTTPEEKVELPVVPGNLTSISLRSYPGSNCALVLYDDAQQPVQRSYCGKLGFARLDRLSFDQQVYYAGVENTRDFQLWSQNDGPPDQGFETEPNFDGKNSTFLNPGFAIAGITSRGDRDVFRIESNGEPFAIDLQSMQAAPLTLTLSGAGNQQLLKREGRPPFSIEPLLLPAGTYHLTLSTNEEIVPYTVRTRTTRLVNRSELEPNDQLETATTLDTSGIARGKLESDDIDTFQFEVTEAQYYRIQATGDSLQDLYLLDGAGRSVANVRHSSNAHNRLRLDGLYLIPGVHSVAVRGRSRTTGNYLLRVLAQGQKPAGYEREPNDSSDTAMPLSTSQVNRGLLNRKDDVDFYRFSLAVETEVSIAVKSPMGKIRWQLNWGRSQLVNEQTRDGQTGSKSLKLQAGDYLLKLQATEPSEEEYLVSFTTTETLPFHSTVSQIPSVMSGHINLLGRSFAGTVLDSQTLQAADPDKRDVYMGLEFLTDGSVVPGQPFVLQDKSFAPIFQFDQPVTFSGFALHPMIGTQNKPEQLLRTFRISIGNQADGLTTLLEGRLSAVPEPQYVALEQEHAARFIKLEFVDNHSSSDRSGNSKLGEFSVLTSAPMKETYNLLAIERGGHVVSVDPPLPTFAREQKLLGVGESLVVQARNMPLQWVVGFHRNQLAYLGSIQWQAATNDLGENRVLVERSTTSDVSGWSALGYLDLGDPMASLVFDQAIPARFLRFTRYGTKQISGPAKIVVTPHKSRPNSAFALIDNADSDADQDIKTREQLTLMGQSNSALQEISGQVRLGQSPVIHQVSVESPHNAILLMVYAPQLQRIRARLREAGSLTWIPLVEDEETHHLLARVAPGNYELVVDEPPRSIVLAWDTSSSTQPYRGVISQAARDFASQLVPGHEEINLLPFGGELMFQQWQADSEAILWQLGRADSAHKSSNAEQYLALASQALAEKEGQRIIVVVTDGLTPKYGPLWQTLSKIRPEIHVLDVIHASGMMGGNAYDAKDRLRNYASVNHGTHSEVSSTAQAQAVFANLASGWLSEAPYEGVIASLHLEDPEPGWLQVLDQEPGDNLLYLIVDGSGSMLKRNQQGSRIAQAKQALVDALALRSQESPAMLRFFGHTQPGSCETQLITPAPVAGTGLNIELNKLAPKNLAKTPIAASIAGAAKDLKKLSKNARVLLVTDGEETCSGDPEKEIVAFRDTHPDTPINIIGFYIDDSNYKGQLERWANLGGGKYFSVGDKVALTEAIAVLSKTHYKVVNTLGQFVTQGTTGEKIEIAPGVYEVRLDTGGVYQFRIASNETKVIKTEGGD